MHDCLILGGGVVGLSLAYELAGHGLTVQVIDRGAIGRESSWAGAGMIPPVDKSPNASPVDQFTTAANELHKHWALELREQTGIDNGYRRCGGIYLLTGREGPADAARQVTQWRAGAIAVEELDARRLAEIEPQLQVLDEPCGAYLLPDEAQIRNPWHMRAVLAGCLARGVVVHPGVEAEDFLLRGDRVEAVRTTLGELRAGAYCIAGGAWSHALAARLGLNVPVRPIRGQIVLLAMDRTPCQRIINVSLRYLVPRGDGRVLIGSTLENVGFDKSTTAAAVAELLDFGQALVPTLRQARFEQAWAGLRPGSPDGQPFLGPVPGLKNIWLAAGHFRHGLQLSTSTALAVGRMMRGEQSGFDMTPFQVERSFATHGG